MRAGWRRVTRAAVAGTLAAGTAWWMKRRAESIEDAPSPGNGAWPPLRAVTAVPDAPRITEPSDGAPAEPAPSGAWVPAHADGSCPMTHPVKVKESSGIYHVEGGLAYGRTNADRCYPGPQEAEADGFRPSKV